MGSTVPGVHARKEFKREWSGDGGGEGSAPEMVDAVAPSASPLGN